MIKRQCQQFRGAGETMPCTLDLVDLTIFQTAFLPGGPVTVLNGQGGPGGCIAGNVGAIGIAEFAKQDVP